jgi:putative intracellular protease/amidase
MAISSKHLEVRKTCKILTGHILKNVILGQFGKPTMNVLIATSTKDFDPSEVAVPWKILRDGGINVVFATDSGMPGVADPRMFSGEGLGLLKTLLIAQKGAREAYQQMLHDPAFQNPISYEDIKSDQYDGLVLPGGHAKGIKPYLESEVLQQTIAAFFAKDKPIGAICHGVVAVCRAKNLDTGKSVLFGRKTTALLKRQELLAWQLTRLNLGDYYRTYPETVEDEVVASLESPNDFTQGPLPVLRDNMNNLSRGFILRDKNYLSARWPGDVHSFGLEFLKMVKGE